mmetsp:Transcript_20642/g.63059  ORF Transcript_20642/g.63059 Transcript_20642/m.63059 type:complete len:321 (-) Transcript_20642:4970-5932(-)
MSLHPLDAAAPSPSALATMPSRPISAGRSAPSPTSCFTPVSDAGSKVDASAGAAGGALMAGSAADSVAGSVADSAASSTVGSAAACAADSAAVSAASSAAGSAADSAAAAIDASDACSALDSMASTDVASIAGSEGAGCVLVLVSAGSSGEFAAASPSPSSWLADGAGCCFRYSLSNPHFWSSSTKSCCSNASTFLRSFVKEGHMPVLSLEKTSTGPYRWLNSLLISVTLTSNEPTRGNFSSPVNVLPTGLPKASTPSRLGLVADCCGSFTLKTKAASPAAGARQPSSEAAWLVYFEADPRRWSDGRCETQCSSSTSSVW